jgi:prepilin-type processing-associated H-X9-DG protein
MQYQNTYNVYPQYRAEYPAITNNYGVVRPRWQWILASYMGGWAQNPEVISALGATYADPTYTYVPMDNKSLVCPAMETTSMMIPGLSTAPSTAVCANYQSIRNGSYGYNFGYLGNCRTLLDGDPTTATLNYPVYSVKEPTRTIAFGDSRGGMVGGGGHSMTLDPPHMVLRKDTQKVTSGYWMQAPFNYAAPGVGPAGYNPYGPDEGTADIKVPFSPAMARHNGRANVVFLDGHTASLSLQELGYSLDASGVPVLQTSFTGTAADLPGYGTASQANNSMWTGRGLDEFDQFYNTDAP